MGIKMIESITRIRITATYNNKCCKNVSITKKMLDMFNSDMYQSFNEQQ